MLFLIGLGLGDAKDITVRGLEIVKSAGKVYLENYTSILCCDKAELEKFYGKTIELVDRELMEQGCDVILESAATEDVAVLIVGDPLNATTHTDLLLRAASRNIPFKVVHNASILNAVACCGLQIYNFGETVSIPFWTDTWKPESFYDKILKNQANSLHTLCLLDIKVSEPNLELMVRGIRKMEPPRFMSISQAAEQLLAIIKDRKNNSPHVENETNIEQSHREDGHNIALNESSLCIGLARVGSDKQEVFQTTLSEAASLDLGPPLHSLVIPAKMHPLEEEMLNVLSKRNLGKTSSLQ